MYRFATIPMMYCLSFLFHVPSLAFICLATGNLFFGWISTTVTATLEILGQDDEVGLNWNPPWTREFLRGFKLVFRTHSTAKYLHYSLLHGLHRNCWKLTTYSWTCFLSCPNIVLGEVFWTWNLPTFSTLVKSTRLVCVSIV